MEFAKSCAPDATTTIVGKGAHFTDLEEAAKAATDCRVPLGWSDTQTVKLTGEDMDMKGRTAGEAARAIQRWVYRQDLAATLAGLQNTTPWSLDAKLGLDQVLRESGRSLATRPASPTSGSRPRRVGPFKSKRNLGAKHVAMAILSIRLIEQGHMR